VASFSIKALVAMTSTRGIGANGGLPWHISEDLKRFKRLTMGHTVVMGSKTYWSLPEAARPLPGRSNVVITRTEQGAYPSSVELVRDLDAWFAEKQRDCSLPIVDGLVVDTDSKQIWVIGGGEIYHQTLHYCSELYVSVIKGIYSTDTFFPEFKDDFEQVSEDDCGDHWFRIYRRKI
jgi:dihydrofolate reductase